MTAVLKRNRLLSSFFAILFLMASGIVVGAGQADAATCSASSCNNKDPDAYGCGSDGRTLASITADWKYQSSAGTQTISTVNMQLRYSPKCKAVWMRTSWPSNSFIPYFRTDSCNHGCTSKIVRVFSVVNAGDVDPDYRWSTMLPYYSSLNYAHICAKDVIEHESSPKTHGPEGCSAWQVL